ncbi:Structure-specific endonuclease subunit Slx1 [Trinorchestia longiramus]|nr:Structure-specific endonuclease subunit Slx1 [Trinorchestia longiramus]
MTQAKDGFYGVYLLVSENPRFAGRTYIGFTVDPQRRLRQHNRGSHAGGAWRTSSKGPWNVKLKERHPDTFKKQVEWAWQHPEFSRRLRQVPRKKTSESRLQYSVRLLGCILRTAPWCALPLTVTWLDQRYYTSFAEDLHPPHHIIVRSCDISELKKNTTAQPQEVANTPALCGLCHRHVKPPYLVRCLHKECSLISHVVCLGQHLLSGSSNSHPTLHPPPWSQLPSDDSTEKSSEKNGASSQGSKVQPQKCGKISRKKSSSKNDWHPAAPLLPVDGTCPTCGQYVLWGDLVRPLSVACASSRGGDRGKGVWVASEDQRVTNDSESEVSDEQNDDHWTNLLTQR